MKLLQAILVLTILNLTQQGGWGQNYQNQGCEHNHQYPTQRNELYQPTNFYDCYRHSHVDQQEPERAVWGGHAYSTYGWNKNNYMDNAYNQPIRENDVLQRDYQQSNYGMRRDGYGRNENQYYGNNIGLEGLNNNMLHDRYYTSNEERRRFNKPAGYYFEDLYYDPDTYSSYGHHSMQP